MPKSKYCRFTLATERKGLEWMTHIRASYASALQNRYEIEKNYKSH